MRVLVACDSFKDALDASSVCAAVAEGLRNRNRDIVATEFPLGDGGEGTGEILRRHLRLDTRSADTVDPKRRRISAQFHIARDKSLAVIELAAASGLQLLTSSERNPLSTTTLGVGQLIVQAVSLGAKRIVLCVGGSATHDCGIGMATAVGWRFLDAAGRDIAPTGGNLRNIHKIVPPKTPLAISVEVLCDVDNPVIGASGAARVYARQKGASDADIEALEAGAEQLIELVRAQRISDAAPAAPGAGAAGGVGYGAQLFLNATLHRGIDYVLDATNFSVAATTADCVVTGEGRLDAQTLHGKVIHGVCERAAGVRKPVIALCGELRATDDEVRRIGLRAAYCINAGLSMDNALEKTAERLAAAAARLELPSA